VTVERDLPQAATAGGNGVSSCDAAEPGAQELTPLAHKFTRQVQVVPDVRPHSFEEFRKTLK
jgi:hypothetical protein